MIPAVDNFYYIFDIEGTLVLTDDLNNESYNYALIQNNLNPINNVERITRKTIELFYNSIEVSLFNKIVQQKQEYFIKHIDKIKCNYFLFSIISKINR